MQLEVGGTTLRGYQLRLRLPPKAAPAVHRPEGADAPMHQSREAHHLEVGADYTCLSAPLAAGYGRRQVGISWLYTGLADSKTISRAAVDR